MTRAAVIGFNFQSSSMLFGFCFPINWLWLIIITQSLNLHCNLLNQIFDIIPGTIMVHFESDFVFKFIHRVLTKVLNEFC